MRKKVLWIAAVLALIAIPAVIGLVALRGDDGSSRRSAALISAGTGGGYQLVFTGGTPAVHAAGKAIDVESYSWGANADASVTSGLLRGSSAKFGDLQITKKIDTASPNLGAGLAKGTQYPSVTLTLYKTSEPDPQIDYLTYKMSDVLITSIQHGGSGNDLPTESISLAYGQLEVIAKDTAAKGGGTPTTFKYNLLTGKA